MSGQSIRNVVRFHRWPALVSSLIFLAPLISLAAVEDEIIDQTNNAKDIQALDLKPKGAWLPVPIPVSNPTVGSGLQAALLYLHPKKSEDSTVPNSTSGIGGMYTDTETRFAGGFHDGSSKDGKYRYRVVFGSGEFNLDFFGLSGDSSLQDNPISYSLTSDLLFSQFLRRIPGTEYWFAGVRYMLITSNVVFDEIFPGAPPISDDMTTSSLGIMTTYDSRDNNYYPSEGSKFELIWTRDSETWGSDFDFRKLDTRYNHYFSLSSDDVLAVRAAFSRAGEDTPFYLLPALKMRGFPRGRYQSDNALSFHTEWRHKFSPRWGYMLSFEAGSAEASSSDLFKEDIITSVGLGVRWQVTKKNKLNLGVDVGYSDGDSALYVQIGERF